MLQYKLIAFLGSPYIKKSEVIFLSDEEKVEMHNIARKNKIGLFFLDKLKKENQLNLLEEQYNSDKIRYEETCKTAVEISSALSSITDEFAVFKFFKPFPHTPSDVDVLFFAPREIFYQVVDKLIAFGNYYRIGDSPSQVVVYDLRGGMENIDKRTVDGKRGGKYYIDLYENVSASHFVYINSETLWKYKIDNYDNSNIQTIDPIADLAVVLTHSIIPEQLYTLGDYYMTLNYINKMNENELDSLVELFKENNIKIAGLEPLRLTNAIHKKVHGVSIHKIDYLIEKLGGSKNNDKLPNNFSLPYRYSISITIKVLFERMKNRKGFISIISQLSHTIVNPRLFRWVLYNIILRRTRETY